MFKVFWFSLLSYLLGLVTLVRLFAWVCVGFVGCCVCLLVGLWVGFVGLICLFVCFNLLLGFVWLIGLVLGGCFCLCTLLFAFVDFVFVGLVCCLCFVILLCLLTFVLLIWVVVLF